MPRIGYLLAATVAVSIMAPGAALAQCVTSGDLICGPGASASLVGEGVVSKSGNVVSARNLEVGDRVIGRSDQSAVAIGACRVNLPVNSLGSIVRSGDSTCVRVANSAPPPPPSSAGATGGLGGGSLIAIGAGVAVIGGIAAAVANRDDKAKSP